jgi:hypothetical protein
MTSKPINITPLDSTRRDGEWVFVEQKSRAAGTVSDAGAKRYTLESDSEDQKSSAVNPGVLLGVKSGLSSNMKRLENSAVPPAIESGFTGFRSLYFKAASAATSQGVSAGQIAGALGGFCTVANTTHAAWTTSIRLKRLTIWPAASTSGETDADVVWSSARTTIIKDSSRSRPVPGGTTVSGGLEFTPPKDSNLSMWLMTSGSLTNYLFYVTCPAYSVIRLDVAFTLPNGQTATTQSISAGTVGQVYYLALDGPSTNKFVPVGNSTTS